METKRGKVCPTRRTQNWLAGKTIGKTDGTVHRKDRAYEKVTLLRVQRSPSWSWRNDEPRLSTKGPADGRKHQLEHCEKVV